MFKPGEKIKCIGIDNNNSFSKRIVEINKIYTFETYEYIHELIRIIEKPGFVYYSKNFIVVDRELKLKKILCIK